MFFIQALSDFERPVLLNHNVQEVSRHRPCPVMKDQCGSLMMFVCNDRVGTTRSPLFVNQGLILSLSEETEFHADVTSLSLWPFVINAHLSRLAKLYAVGVKNK